LADALGSIERGARLSRDSLRKRNLFFGDLNAPFFWNR
jgi:hypothetical protein